MVSRNVSRVHPTHGIAPLDRVAALRRKPLAPSSGPGVERCRVLEQATHGVIRCSVSARVRQVSERQCEVGSVGSHAFEQIMGKCEIVRRLLTEPKFPAQPGTMERLKLFGE